MVFQFEHVGLADGPGGKFDPVPVDHVALKANLASWQDALAPQAEPDGSLTERGWNSNYWDNHDQPRAVSRFGDDHHSLRAMSAKTLASILHMHRGTPYIYQGEELGMTSTVFPDISSFRDLESLNHYRERVAAGDDPAVVVNSLRPNSRDNARTPVQWEPGPGAGFTTGTPWIPIAPNADEVNAASQVGVPGSVFEHHRALISLRHADPAMALGTFRLFDATSPDTWIILRSWKGADGAERQLLLLAAYGRAPLDLTEGGALRARLAAEGLDLGEWADAERVLLASLPVEQADALGLGAPDRLEAWDSLILRRTL